MTTRIGGFTSILALLIMFLYSILKLNVMFLRTNTTVLSLPMEADTESLKTINFYSTSILVYYRVRSS